MLKNIKRCAFTLAEVMVVLAIVTAVVAVSIKITKARFDSANRYLYYAAYSALKDVTAEIHLEENSKPLPTSATDPTAPSEPTIPMAPGTWVSLPEDDDEFCNTFSDYANISAGSSVCSGSSSDDVENAVSSTEKDFSLLTPDLILRNGMKLYNMRKVYDSLPLFSNFTIYDGDGNENTTQTGYARKVYKIYIDIDGARNSSVLWEDVFPFYIALNGYIIPAYSDSSSAGANNLDHMATSVEYDDTNTSTGRPLSRWLYKNITWQEAACKAGFVNGTYCMGVGDVDTQCVKAPGNYSDCRVKVIVPLKG